MITDEPTKMNLHKFNYIDEPFIIGYTLVGYTPYEFDEKHYIINTNNLNTYGCFLMDNYIEDTDKYMIINMDFNGEFSPVIKKLLPEMKRLIREYKLNSLL
jgi:hypothetical protein